MLDVTAHPVVDAHQQDVGSASPTPTPSGSRPGPRWHVVATYSQAERRAVANLTRQGYRCYLPLITLTRRDRAVRSMLHRIEAPLFSGYCFCQFDPMTTEWHPIRNTPGVFQLLTNATGMPAPVPDHILAAIQATEDARRSLPPPRARWAPGAACSLAAGPMRGLPAVVTRCTDDTATIACLFLAQLREITVPVESLEERDA